MDIKVISFNIRYAKGDKGTKNDWNHRKEKIIKIIHKFSPNIIGFQEVLYEQLKFLIENLNGYNYVGVARRDGEKKGEFTPIFYKDVKLVDSGTFWLSGTPDVCSNTWNRGFCYRICTWANFETDKQFGFYNTHLEVRKASIRFKSIPLILEKINQYSKNMKILLTGDMNFEPDSKEYKLMTTNLNDLFLQIHKKNKDIITFHDFKGVQKREKSKSRDLFHLKYRLRFIDYMFSKGKIKTNDIKIIYDNPEPNLNTFPSDHYPIFADIEI